VSSYDERELERMLRTALESEARRQEPAGDGLTMIRERVRNRRRWARWLKPTLALAAAAAVVTALIAAPPYLTSGGAKPALVDAAAPSRQVELSPPSATPAPATPTPSPTPQSAGPSDPWGTPIAGDRDLPDRVAIWPYPSRRIGHDRADSDVAAGRYPNLADPGQTAVDFVASYIGSEQGLTATRMGRADPGVQMLVQRRDAKGATVAVSNVFLVRVRKADNSPYVVLGASRVGLGDSLAIFPLPRLSGTATFTVTGNIRRPAGTDGPTVRVSLREPGSTDDLGLGTAPPAASGSSPRTWSVELAPFRQLASSGVVAAWTTDTEGHVQEFVAAPITP
jgi:hypothetical protein